MLPLFTLAEHCRDGWLRLATAVLLAVGLAASASGTPARSAEQAIQSHYGIAWEQIPPPPSPTSWTMPRYSRMVRRIREPAVVKAAFLIDQDGRVEALRCFCDANSRLAAESHAALVRWRFPKQAGGPYRLMITVRPADESGGLSLDFE